MVINGIDLLTLSPIENMEIDKVTSKGLSYGLGEAGYDIRIKQDIWFCPQTDTFSIDGKTGKGKFALASAIEKFKMPANLVGIVHDKSTWARQGLSVFNTVIEPGWIGYLTLELVHHGNEKLHIPSGVGIAQVVFHRLSAPARYSGKYQNQDDMPVGSKFI